MKEAMQQVKADLGADAVILHTKKYREGGILGFNAKEVVEVTAAIEDAPEPPKKKAAPKKSRIDVVSAPASTEIPPVTTAQRSQGLRAYGSYSTPQEKTPEERQAAQARFDAMVESLAKGAETPEPLQNLPKEAEPAAKEAYPPSASPEESGKQEEKDTGDAMNDKDAQKIQALEAELAQMKTLLAQVMVKDQPKGVRTLADALSEQEVAEDIQKDLAATVAAGETARDSLTPEAHAALAGYLSKKIRFSDGLDLEKGKKGASILALIGATGVGKTTTLAKIAARFVLEQGVDAALITADTYRISAVEQLKTYSDIIGLPLEIVYSPQELKTAIHKFRKKDLILIDTAGRSQHNAYQMQELCDFLAVHPHIARYLVMSATTKSRDAADILEKFAPCKPDHIIFTKTDETASLGLIPNLLFEKDIRLAFLTNGQSVPDDIVPATPEALADLLLRE